MKITDKIAISSVYLWLGFVLAISFLEAWLKFQAPGITIPLGLGIGRLVFFALNKTEWFFAVLILLMQIKSGNWKQIRMEWLALLIILLLQTFWLLPLLDVRAEKVIQMVEIEPSSLHYYYVALEMIKVLILFVFGKKLFKSA
ncbi:hypothetical protein [Avrilella dinanensis]|uniref:DUF4149 domain-containing protein n=1 Tax=Avrilella dinanensis TaxID=2008672 RepID=A0A2M9R6H9_9FLAO|nr:hypothetical protein [Avrilella dinanensis]PJR04478.1 hypothetical protein CDL10_07940 [Avrilella dinanensis]